MAARAGSAARRSRWGALVTVVSALRVASRPGSAGVGERVASLPRLVRATLRGEYAGLRGATLAGLLGAVVYVLSPVDLVPEALLPVLGMADDAMVVAWLAAALVSATEDFLTWERGMPPHRTDAPGPQDATPSDWARSADRPAAAQTVRSHVVS